MWLKRQAALVAMILGAAVAASAQAPAPPQSTTQQPRQPQQQTQPQAPSQQQNQGQTPPTSGMHTITVKFTYDFRLTPACSGKVRKKCVAQFNLYDLSAGYKHRTKLFSIPVGTVTERSVRELTGTSPLLLFESGRHLIGVAAQGPEPEKLESNPKECTTWVEIP
jgi:hypothetical protein